MCTYACVRTYFVYELQEVEDDVNHTHVHRHEVEHDMLQRVRFELELVRNIAAQTEEYQMEDQTPELEPCLFAPFGASWMKGGPVWMTPKSMPRALGMNVGGQFVDSQATVVGAWQGRGTRRHLCILTLVHYMSAEKGKPALSYLMPRLLIEGDSY
eukprot:1157415-Pelagomonas_calceolata.AAC.2